MAVLMVGENMLRQSRLAEFLQQNGWQVDREPIVRRAMCLIDARPFDLILSDIKVTHAGRIRMVSSVMRSGGTLFFSLAVSFGSWWLPAVRLGDSCLGSTVLSSQEFETAIRQLAVQVKDDPRTWQEASRPRESVTQEHEAAERASGLLLAR
jgi:hypothetical protein